MSILKDTTLKYETNFWNDSCDLKELDYALENHCVGATTNPIIVKNVLASNLDKYEDYIKETISYNPNLTEDEIAWIIIEKLAVDGANKLKPIFNSTTGEGRISIQTNNKYYKNSELLVKQALHFKTLAENIQVKIPATKAGIKAIEDVTYNGVSINATVSFTVPQAIAVAEAVERGLSRRLADGKDNSTITPVCTLMIGRLDDYMKKVVSKENYLISPEALEWAGIACAKKYYSLYKSRNYKTKLLTAAFRNIHHWTSLVGGDLLATIPAGFQKKLNGSTIEIKSEIDNVIEKRYLDELMEIPQFRQAYNIDGMTIDEFDTYGATKDTLSQFFAGYDELVCIIRKYIIQ